MSGDKSKDALSRALGAAFLSHQVQQLENTIERGHAAGSRANSTHGHGGVKGSRRGQENVRGCGNGDRGVQGGGSVGGKRIPGGGHRQLTGYGGRGTERERAKDEERCSDPEEKDKDSHTKDADVIVVDASVLVHAIGELKKWCRAKREEIVIIPLEVLNTLDLLKKGTSLHAQRARAASRILEQQVGTNSRIKVQSDDAYVLWGEIPFDSTVSEEDESLDPKSMQSSPEWLRRIISCARWELDQTEKVDGDKEQDKSWPKVALAVCLSSAMPDRPVTPDGNSLPISSSPVPLPVPILQAQRHEQRAAGTLVKQWAHKAGIQVLNFPSTPLPQHMLGGSEADNTTTRGTGSNRSHQRSKSRQGHSRGPSDEFTGRKVNIRDIAGPNAGIPRPVKYFSPPATLNGPTEKIVERPAATIAMNASSILQPTRVIRVLARGEKLEP